MGTAIDGDATTTQRPAVGRGAPGRPRRHSWEVTAAEHALVEVGRWIKAVLKTSSNADDVPDAYRCFLPVRRRRDNRLNQADLAALLGISASRMSEIINGKYRYLTEETLERLADILQLSPAERRHLLDLYRNHRPTADDPAAPTPGALEPAVFANLLRQLEPLPAMLCTPWMDLEAWNSAATRMLGDFDAIKRHAPGELNIMIQMFCNPATRTRFVDWEHVVQELVASFRRQMSRFQDPVNAKGFRDLVEELQSRSPDFAEYWQGHEVRLDPLRPKMVRHPEVGTLVLDQWVLDILGLDGRLCLVLFIPQAESDARARLVRLMDRIP